MILSMEKTAVVQIISEHKPISSGKPAHMKQDAKMNGKESVTILNATNEHRRHKFLVCRPFGLH